MSFARSTIGNFIEARAFTEVVAKVITITVENADHGDLFVSITDLNQAGSPVIVDRMRIKPSESMPVDIQEDGHDSGKILWKAQRTDNQSKTAQRTATPGAGDTVEVTTQFG